MFIRVTRARYDAADEATVERLVKEQLVPAIKRLPGFQHYHGGLDRAAKRLVAISVWDTEENSRAIASQRAQFESVGVTFDPPETYELTEEA